jgi:WD40 repeat protein
VLLFDVGLRKVRATLDTDGEDAYSLTFDPDGKMLAVGTGKFNPDKGDWARGHVWIWDPAKAELKKKWEIADSRVTALAFSPDGKALATGSDTRPTGNFITTPRWGHGNGVVKLWEVGTWKLRAESEVHVAAVEALAFSTDGKTLVYTTGWIRQYVIGGFGSTTSWGEVFLLDGKSLKRLVEKPLDVSSSVETVRYSPAAGVLAADNGSKLGLWKVDPGK